MDASLKAQARKPNYSIKQSETVVSGQDVQVRVMTLAPGQAIPWHYHSEITDHYFVFKGSLTIETRSPDATSTLAIGDRHQLVPGSAHRLSNRGIVDCQFLLLQGVGRYDWIKAEEAV
jgi:quercetin dioxygenase-like cupin family protein